MFVLDKDLIMIGAIYETQSPRDSGKDNVQQR